MLLTRVCIVSCIGLWGSTLWAQTQPPSPSSAPAFTAAPAPAAPGAPPAALFPVQPAPAQPPPQPVAQPAPAQPTPAPAQPAPAQPAPQPVAQPAPTAPADPPYAQPAPAQPAPAPQPSYAASPPASGEASYSGSSGYASSPPPQEEDSGSSSVGIPDFSVRVDPLNWILYGRLGLELEIEALEWLTLETVPMFVVSEQPVVFNQADDIYQKGDGLGALAGASIGLGLWLDGDSFNGTVLRPAFNFYSVQYRSEALEDSGAGFGSVAAGDILDSATVKERRLSITIGSHLTWGYFTLAGGFGLEYELSKDRRCIVSVGDVFEASTDDADCGDDDEFNLARGSLDSAAPPEQANLFGGLHPFYLAGRISLGFVLDKND